MRNSRLLVIDDEPEIGMFICAIAQLCGYDVRAIADPEAFQATYREWRPDTVVLDLRIPGTDGVELLRFLGEERSCTRILLVSGMGGDMLDIVKRLGGAYDLNIAATMQKPIRAAELRAVLEEASVTPDAKRNR